MYNEEQYKRLARGRVFRHNMARKVGNDVSVPILCVIGNFVSDIPWYVMALVPFWGSERINKKAVIAIFIAFPLLRASVGGILYAFLPDWEMWDQIYYIFHTCFNIAAYYFCFKVNVSKLLYTMLLMVTLGTSVNSLAHMAVQPFLTDTGLIIVAQPAWIAAVALLNACLLPFVYRLAKGRLRRAFTELSAKSILSMCIVPALNYLMFNISFAVQGAFTNVMISFLIAFFGAISSYVTLRMVTDTVKRINTEKKLAELDWMNNLKTELMTTISHEARTPLAVLASYSGLIAMELREKGVDKQTAADLDTIAFEAKRVANLIDGMKRLTLRDAQTTSRVRLDLTELIRQTARLYQHIFDRKNVTLTLNLDDDLPPVFGSPEELTQVLLNLLQNAKNHTEQGVVSIAAEKRGETIAVIVTDTGAGVPLEILGRVFERGVSGDGSGTGLGLAICKEVIRSHGGTIEIESKQNKGTTVVFTLPIYAEGDDGYGQ